MEKKETGQQAEMITFFQHEAICARLERTQRRLWLTGLIGMAALVASNLLWILHFWR